MIPFFLIDLMRIHQPEQRKDKYGVPDLRHVPSQSEYMRSFLRYLKSKNLVWTFKIPPVENNYTNVLDEFARGFNDMLENAERKEAYRWPCHESTTNFEDAEDDDDATTLELRKLYDSLPFHILRLKKNQGNFEMKYAVDETLDHKFFLPHTIKLFCKREFLRHPINNSYLIFIC